MIETLCLNLSITYIIPSQLFTSACWVGSPWHEPSFPNNSFLIFHFQVLLIINFSSRTTSMDIQRNMEANVEKRTKETYGPPMGKRLIVFMDDMNMPRVRICTQVCKSVSRGIQAFLMEQEWSWCQEGNALHPLFLKKLTCVRGAILDQTKGSFNPGP